MAEVYRDCFADRWKWLVSVVMSKNLIMIVGGSRRVERARRGDLG